LGDGYAEQYWFMLSTLGLGAVKMGEWFYAAVLLSKLVLLAPRRSTQTFRALRSDPLSHNYLLGLIHKN
jgi:hypothetical protein